MVNFVVNRYRGWTWGYSCLIADGRKERGRSLDTPYLSKPPQGIKTRFRNGGRYVVMLFVRGMFPSGSADE
jgi:hypothetical protein